MDNRKRIFKPSCCLIIVSLLAGCTQNTETPSQTDSSILQSVQEGTDSSQTAASQQTITADKPVVPLTIQSDIPIEEGETISTEFVTGNSCYLSVLNRQVAQMYPTVRQYRLDLNDLSLSVLKERDPHSLERVWQFFELNGILYESLIAVEDGNLVGKVLADGNEIWKSVIPGIPYAPAFAIDGNNLYVTIRDSASGELVDQVYRIDPSTGMNLLWQSGDENGF